jgi:hypothetical protein
MFRELIPRLAGDYRVVAPVPWVFSVGRPVCGLMPLVAAEFTHESGPVVRRCQQVLWLRHR